MSCDMTILNVPDFHPKILSLVLFLHTGFGFCGDMAGLQVLGKIHAKFFR